MMEVVIIAAAATLGNLLNGWESSTIAGFFFSSLSIISHLLV